MSKSPRIILLNDVGSALLIFASAFLATLLVILVHRAVTPGQVRS